MIYWTSALCLCIKCWQVSREGPPVCSQHFPAPASPLRAWWWFWGHGARGRLSHLDRRHPSEQGSAVPSVPCSVGCPSARCPREARHPGGLWGPWGSLGWCTEHSQQAPLRDGAHLTALSWQPPAWCWHRLRDDSVGLGVCSALCAWGPRLLVLQSRFDLRVQ